MTATPQTKAPQTNAPVQDLGVLKIDASKSRNTANGTQSVLFPDLNLVKPYPTTMSDSEIDYDAHVNLRGNSPEDYHLNTEPNNIFQGAFKGIQSYLQYGQQAMKLLAVRPDVALGLSKDIPPDQLAETYKPWADIWNDTMQAYPATKAVKEGVDNLLTKAPLPVAFAPWFVTEFVPTQLLEFGTKPINWIGSYGIEKLGPVVLNKALQMASPEVRSFLLKDIFKSEVKLQPDFETLGLSPNAPTSEVVKAWKTKAFETHPDKGGNPEDFISARKAFDNIMETRQTFLNKILDNFRPQTKPMQAGPTRLLGSEAGSADLVPSFEPGDLAKVGEDVVKITNIAGKVATVNLAGKAVDMGLDKLTPYKPAGSAAEPPSTEQPQGLGDINPEQPPSESAINLERVQISDEAKTNLKKATDVLGEEIQNQTGKPLTHEEVIEKAKESEILKAGVSRESTLNFEAALLKTRQHLASLAEQPELTPEFLDTLKVVANTGTDIARQLGSFKIDAMPEYATQKVNIIKKLQEIGIESNKIIEAAKGVDFKNQQQVAQFYRKFVKPTLGEKLNEIAYMNILSSPSTHIVNTFSNAIQMLGLNPLTKLASGGVDLVASALSGAERTHYLSEIPKFYKGAINAVPDAISNAILAMKGKTYVERPDIKNIPTLSKFVNVATLGVGKYVTRALEASDIFFRTMIEHGELEALADRYGPSPNDKQTMAIAKEAKRRAEYYVFRQKPDSKNSNGQGNLLSTIDQMTSAVYKFRDIPGAKWFIRFVQTPMNILKQGIEYSPAGLATLGGAKDKSEQIGKAMVGSMVFAGASYMAMTGNSTWSLPRGQKERKLFYQSGRMPYSVRIGDRWYSYSRLGPLAYPIAMAAALHYYEKEGPNALSDSQMEKVAQSMAGIMGFFSDQSYLQGIGDMTKTLQGDSEAVSRMVSNIPSQVLIPLVSLQGWVNQIIDPLYRKKSKGLSLEAIMKNLQQKVVGLSQQLPADKDLFGQPRAKEDLSSRILNALSPIKSSKSDQSLEELYNVQGDIKQQKTKIKKAKEKALENAKN